MAMAAPGMAPKKPKVVAPVAAAPPVMEPFDPFEEMFGIQQRQMDSQRQAIQEDLARQEAQFRQQEAQRQEQLRWQQEQAGRQVGQIQTETPQTLGRLGSQYAARGSFGSGARQEAQGDVQKSADQQIAEIQRASEQLKTQEEWEGLRQQWEKEGLHVQARRQLEAIDLQRESEQLQYKAGLSQRSAQKSAGSQIDPDKYRSEATAYRDARTNIYRSQGLDARGAQVQAIQDMKTRYPHLEETWLYSGAGGAPPKATGKTYGTYDVSAARGADTDPATQNKLRTQSRYKDAVGYANEWFAETSGKGNFNHWLTKNYSKGAEFLKKNPVTVSVALADVLYATAR